ncbi:ArgE/DapE family deacylase [soil metagenome]
MAPKPVGEVLDTVDRQMDETVEALQELVRIPSVTGNENVAQAHMADLLGGAGLEVEVFTPTRAEVADHPSFSDDGLALGERPVVIGRARVATGPVVVLNGHIDVVPPGDEDRWHHPPWSGTVDDGAVWGRGSCDMKGGLIAGWAALRAIASVGCDLDVSIVFASVIGEETGGVGTLSSIQRGHVGDAAIVLEPTRGEICPIGAGALSFEVEIEGKAAHGAMRQHGVSAIDKFRVVLDALETLETDRNQRFDHPLFRSGDLTAPLSVGVLSAGDWISTVPERLVAAGRYGVLPGESVAEARAEFERRVEDSTADDEWLSEHPPMVRWVEGQFAPAETSVDSPLVTALRKAHSAVVGGNVGLHGVPYGSDQRFYVNDAQMDAVLYGPGDVRHAHTIDERVPIADVSQVAKVVAATLLQWDSGNT